MFKLPVARLFICVYLLLFISISVYAGPSVRSFRCGNRVVKLGDKKHEVMTICGEPTTRELIGTDEEGYYSERAEEFLFPEERYKDGAYETKTVKVEEWYYNCGSRNFSYILSFKGSALKEIKQVGYGDGKSDCDRSFSQKEIPPEVPEEESLGKGVCDKTLKPFTELSKKSGIPADQLIKEAINYLYIKYSGN
jgi:hypothetical protein